MKTTSANTKKRSSSVKCPKSEDSQHFSVTLHHGGEFYRVFEEEIIYRGGTDTTVNGIHVSNWNMDNIEKLLSRLGYKADCVRVWTKVLEIQDGFFLIRKDDDAVDDFALYFSATDMPVPTIMSQTGSSVASSITKQSRKRVEKKPIIKRRQSERIKLSWFKRPITGEGISSDKPITLPENEDIPTSK
ncbi:hypothetical protein KIW84_033586 [Lathyrus oleraceus]|uniref:PB1-like domain-containing protein n=1 Tax=Pisum sativum TaxID=3888 RepID=A0A9D4XWA7_PEA|nr:hypothetical protein KIW84_033586 [Pisum sativum]